MFVKPLRKDLLIYLKKHNIEKKFDKQVKLFEQNPSYPSLNTEVLEPKQLKIYSFRIDRKYRVIFIFTSPEELEIIDINDHYQ
jgi:Txe/YoeB family toxin of Txe-Axe toxin-antitoxin module